MRGFVWAMCLALTAGAAVAAPLKPKPKRVIAKPSPATNSTAPVTDKPAPVVPVVPAVQPKPAQAGDCSFEARENFIYGTIAARELELQHALNGLTRALELCPQAYTAFNLAEINLRFGRIKPAIESFKRYLELAPRAADRTEIQKLIKTLETADPVVGIGGRVHDSEGLADAIVLLDGVVLGASPVTVRTRVGDHIAERITAKTYAHTPFGVQPGAIEYVNVNADNLPQPGNVILSGSPSLPRDWQIGKIRVEARTPFMLAAGRYKATSTARDCHTIELEVKADRDLTYVYVELATDEVDYCHPIVKVTTQRLKRPQ